MKVTLQAWFNGRGLPAPASREWVDGLVPSCLVYHADVDAVLRDQLPLDTIWERMNVDSRPTGRVERSLSVGDYIVVTSKGEGWETCNAFHVMSVGFSEANVPTAIYTRFRGGRAPA